ncbi:hypothetical protein J31TS4_27770 [Paenibacillus sp. J31TS4]|uniref:GNAT family N-acetyltransferase n=1 Tax=Paenibacillus sp. J31TS4 TaxID=2807195 RepID=UPI001B162968|nr:GNAT family N-acetyltransferase [Paenibacillus sp. J31TS4]GIP39497.1 hypothetical protein J31TS4_27770 [Paenibacillus sp. J31TS4]
MKIQRAGSAMLHRLLTWCEESGMLSVHLFSAEGKAPFYEAHGFRRRSEGAPGMVWTGHSR